MKSTKPLFKDLKLIVSRMKDINGYVYIDEQEGLSKLKRINKETTHYKSTIREIVEKEEKCYKVLKKSQYYKIKRQQIPEDEDDL